MYVFYIDVVCLFACLFVRPYKDQSALDIVTSEEMKNLLTSPVKEPEPVANGDSTNLDSGKPNMDMCILINKVTMDFKQRQR